MLQIYLNPSKKQNEAVHLRKELIFLILVSNKSARVYLAVSLKDAVHSLQFTIQFTIEL